MQSFISFVTKRPKHLSRVSPLPALSSWLQLSSVGGAGPCGRSTMLLSTRHRCKATRHKAAHWKAARAAQPAIHDRSFATRRRREHRHGTAPTALEEHCFGNSRLNRKLHKNHLAAGPPTPRPFGKRCQRPQGGPPENPTFMAVFSSLWAGFLAVLGPFENALRQGFPIFKNPYI